MEKKEIFAARLKNARVMKGYSMDELVAAMGNYISKMAISKYEKCQLSPNSTILISLANALGQPVDYFFRPFTLQIDSVKFRKAKSNLAKKQEESIKENIADLVERYINIEEICDCAVKFRSPFEKEISTREETLFNANELRDYWNLGQDGIVNVIELLEDHGIKVMEVDAPESFDGLSSMVNDIYPVVVLNKNLSSERKRFTALHELGHLILSFAESVSEKDEEKLCHLFASELLIPTKVFKELIGESRREISYQELRSVQLKFGISADALMYKAKECGIISEQKYKSFCIQKSKSEWLKSSFEKSLYPVEESTRLVRLVYKALSHELISVSKASGLLHQDVNEVRSNIGLA